MQIIACVDCEVPSFTSLPNGETLLRLHFGHTEADIRSAGVKLSTQTVDEFVRLWVDADYPRRFTPQGPDLLITARAD